MWSKVGVIMNISGVIMDSIVDGPFIMEKKDLLLNFRGSSNQRLIDVQKYLKGDKDFSLSPFCWLLCKEISCW